MIPTVALAIAALLGAPLFAIIAAFVMNAFEATELMETENRAGPTLLNR